MKTNLIISYFLISLFGISVFAGSFSPVIQAKDSDSTIRLSPRSEPEHFSLEERILEVLGRGFTPFELRDYFQTEAVFPKGLLFKIVVGPPDVYYNPERILSFKMSVILLPAADQEEIFAEIEFIKRIGQENIVVNFERIRLPRCFRGLGITERFVISFVKWLQMYDSHPDSKITLTATTKNDSDDPEGNLIGAYYWARLGFDTKPDCERFGQEALIFKFIKFIQDKYLVFSDAETSAPTFEDFHADSSERITAFELPDHPKARLIEEIKALKHPWEIAEYSAPFIMDGDGKIGREFLLKSHHVFYKAALYFNQPASPGMVRLRSKTAERSSKELELSVAGTASGLK